MSISFLGFPEEVLHQVVLFLVDDSDYEYLSYPKSLYHLASRAIIALSLVNHRCRRICLPLLFTYTKCRTLEELYDLERECMMSAAFTGCIRILEVALSREPQRPTAEILEESLLRLLPLLQSLVWVELRTNMIRGTPGLITAIHTHPTLETASISYLPFSPLPQSPAKLEKLLLHKVSTYGADEDMEDPTATISVVQNRDIGVTSLELGPEDVLPLETLRIHHLRELSIDPSLIIATEKLERFLAHHPSLMKISFEDPMSSWEQNYLLQRHTSSFLAAVKAYTLEDAMDVTFLCLSRGASSSHTRRDGWEVTELGLTIGSSWVEYLSLAATVFPKLLSLTVHYDEPINPISVAAWISKHLPTVRSLELNMPEQQRASLLIPLKEDLSDKRFDDDAVRLRLIAWEIFQASPSMMNLGIVEREQNYKWSLDGSYRPIRDFLGAIVKMKMVSVLYVEPRTPSVQYQGTIVL
ncbi:hypothetical protein C8J56DRAFT_933079 [Mycena floridula]|nr:hypothetical protein C8J56DRAFT_933079 [Mycena floridula]